NSTHGYHLHTVKNSIVLNSTGTQAAGAPVGGAQTLPRGPHKLSREAVVRSQRARLIRAMAEAMAERGYANTSVADVLGRARVSRETFYQQFSSKQDCFIAAYEEAVGRILASLTRASRGE